MENKDVADFSVSKFINYMRLDKVKRRDGYYWVIYEGDWFIGEYELDHNDGSDIWWVCGFPDKFQESELDFIDELMIPKHN